MFISFEGIDGCGKTTQTQLLADHFAAHGKPFVLTREPGGEPLAEKLRELLLHNEWEVESEMLLFLAARTQHVRRIITPALQAGRAVICDRFMDSSRIYQGVAKGLGVGFYDALHRLTLGDFKPHLTFLLDISAEDGLQRAQGRGEKQDYFESLGLDFQQKLRAGFLQLAGSEPNRIITLDATLPPEALHQLIIQRIKLWQE